MSSFHIPVRLYMTSPVATVGPAHPLQEAHRRMVESRVSSLAVVEDGAPVGVISRTDLLRAGHRGTGSTPEAASLILPDRPVSDEMTAEVVTVGPDAHLSEAAAAMVGARVHRVYVVDGGAIAGVVSTRDLMRALEEKRTGQKVEEFMVSPVFTIRDEEPVGEAVDRLDRAHISGIIVVEDGWPVGVFGMAEALDAQHLPRSTPVGDAMNPRILVLPSTTSLHRAAAQAHALGVRRVVIQDGTEVKGILSGLDFARAVA